MHRTPPGVDWRAIEQENGRQLQEFRNRLVGEQGKSNVAVWSERGSRNLAGRMHCMALSAAGDSLYAGSSLGGVWMADLHGNGWRPLSDNLYGGSHGLAVASDPVETITSISIDGLVNYTVDRGQTWVRPGGLPALIATAKRVLHDPSSTSRIYLMLQKGVGTWRLSVSEDGGASYTRIMNLGTTQGDIWIDRVNGGDLYLQKGLQTLRTSDQGATWDTLGTLPAGSAVEVFLVGSEAGAPTLYSIVQDVTQWKLYRSTDAGTTWVHRHDINDSYWQWPEFRSFSASIGDSSLVLYGGVRCNRSSDGGLSFLPVTDITQYYVDSLSNLHPDIPGIQAVKIGPDEVLYISTDGGLYRSDDLAATVTNISLEFLRVGQYYSTLTHVNNPELILAGSQDQGYQRSSDTPIDGVTNFIQLLVGDYGHLTSSDGTHAVVFSSYPGFILAGLGNDPHVPTATIEFPPGESYPALPYIQADPDDQNAFYFCGRYLYRYDRMPANGWYYTQLPYNFSESGPNYLTAFAISPIDHDRRYAVNNLGKVWHTSDAGSTWTKSTDDGPWADGIYGTAIAPSSADIDLVYLGGSGYGGSAVYRSTDGGDSWTAMSTGLPLTIAYDLAWEGTGTGILYASTEAGPYRFDPAGEEWNYIGGTDAPLTKYWSVEAVPAAGIMRFGTYGRGIWDFDYSVATEIAPAGEAIPSNSAVNLVNRPNPFNPSTTIQFRMARPAHITLSVFDISGRRVRTLASDWADAGNHEFLWDGCDQSGKPIASGTYFARLESGDGVTTRRMNLIR